jgi:hypothetical protein
MRPLDAVLDGRFQCEQHGRSFENRSAEMTTITREAQHEGDAPVLSTEKEDDDYGDRSEPTVCRRESSGEKGTQCTERTGSRDAAGPGMRHLPERHKTVG